MVVERHRDRGVQQAYSLRLPAFTLEPVLPAAETFKLLGQAPSEKQAVGCATEPSMRTRQMTGRGGDRAGTAVVTFLPLSRAQLTAVTETKGGVSDP